MKKILFSVLFTGCLAGCATAPVVSSDKPLPQLVQGQPVYVAIGQDNFPDENKQVQRLFVEAFTPYMKPIFQSQRPLSFMYMTKIADILKTGYIIYPEITQWEDHNTPWTTVRDKVTLRVTIIDAKSQRILFKDNLSGKSSLWRTRNEKPDVVANDLVNRFVTEILK